MKVKLKKIIAFLFAFKCGIAFLAILLDKKVANNAEEDLDRLQYQNIYSFKHKKLFFNYALQTNYCFREIFRYRLKQYNHPILYYVSFLFLFRKKDIEIWGKIEPGFCIYHGVGDVLVCNKAGKNFSVFQNVTIGKNPNKVVNNVCTPSFGDNVSVYANAVVIGGIKVGNNVNIGAGAVVYKDVPDNCTVVGNPMRIIRKNKNVK